MLFMEFLFNFFVQYYLLLLTIGRAGDCQQFKVNYICKDISVECEQESN